MVPFYAYRVIHSNNHEFYLATLQSKIRLFLWADSVLIALPSRLLI